MKVIVFAVLEPFTDPKELPATKVPVCNSKVTAPAIPQTFNVLNTLSNEAKLPVEPTVYVPAAKGPVHSVENVNGPSHVPGLQQFST